MLSDRFYRSPETILQCQYGMPIDMWSFGCILAELTSGHPLMPGEDEYDQFACIVELLGLPPKSLLATAREERIKVLITSEGFPRYCAKAREYVDGKYILKGGMSKRGNWRGPPASRSWTTALKNYDCEEEFIDFVKRCLEWDPKLRLTPHEALRHPWILGKRSLESEDPSPLMNHSPKIIEHDTTSQISPKNTIIITALH